MSDLISKELYEDVKKILKEKDECIAKLEGENKMCISAAYGWQAKVAKLENEIDEIHHTGGCSYIRLFEANERIAQLEAKYAKMEVCTCPVRYVIHANDCPATKESK